MPNPFMRLGTPKTQSTEPPTHPEPVPEEFADEVFAYRGTEDHGVEGGEEYENPTGYEGTIDAIFEPEPTPEIVVPVRIVQDVARQRRVNRSFQVPVRVGDAQPTMLLGRNDARISARIRFMFANDSDVIALGGSVDQATIQQGYLLRTPPAVFTPITETLDAQSEYFVSAPQNAGSVNGTIIVISVMETVAVNI